MQVHNLEKVCTCYVTRLFNAYLVSAFVSYKHYERTMVLLDIVVDEDGYPWVELLAHEEDRVRRVTINELVQKTR